MKVVFKTSFVKDVRKIKNRSLAARIRSTIESIEQASTLQEIANLKPLKGATGYYRVRLGDYRIGLRIEDETITVIRFLHRKDVYRYFP